MPHETELAQAGLAVDLSAVETALNGHTKPIVERLLADWSSELGDWKAHLELALNRLLITLTLAQLSQNEPAPIRTISKQLAEAVEHQAESDLADLLETWVRS